ncbi:ABC-type sugar transport system ATPase subunit [Bradyrhizobium sp. USDA 4448]
MSQSEQALKITGVGKRFGATNALFNVSMTLAKGEVLGLVGENGAGKSTLMKILAGAHVPDQGEVEVNGVRVDIREPADAQRVGISIIYQELSLFPDLNAVENIFIGREISIGATPKLTSPLRKKTMRDRAQQILSQVLNVELDLACPVGSLTLAQRQIVEIARALNSNANILIMDEPTEALERAERERLVRIINDLKRAGKSVIYVSHKLDEVLTICDRVIVLRDGACVADLPASALDVSKVISLMIGGSLGKQFPAKTSPGVDPILRVEGLSRKGAFQDICFNLREGEILGIAGLEGSGKSSLVRALFGDGAADAGNISLKGKPVAIDSISSAMRSGIAFLPAERKTQGIFAEHSVGWNLTAPSLPKLGGIRLNRRAERSWCIKYIKEMGIKSEGPHQPIGRLSGGNQQKVLLARWLLTEPEVMLLEEPTRGIDIKAKADVYQLIVASSRMGKGIIVVSSDSTELIGLCHRILVMFEGEAAGILDASSTSEETIASLSIQRTYEGNRGG